MSEFIWYKNVEENRKRIQKIKREQLIKGMKVRSAYEALTEDSGDPEINRRRLKIIEDYCDDNEYSLKALYPSNKINVHFKCADCGYNWYTNLHSRIFRASQCPNCIGQIVNENNNLGKWCEENGEYGKQLMEEYCDDNEKDIWNIAAHSGDKVWWKCNKCGNRWFTWVGNRTGKQRRGCAKCLKKNTSKGEQIFLYILQRAFGEDKVINQIKIDGFEVDVYMPELKFGIEYGSYRWHGLDEKREYDTKKREYLKSIGLDILYIIECDKEEEPDIYYDYYFKYYNDFSLNGAREFLKEYFIKKYNIDLNVSLTEEELTKCVDNCLVGDTREFELKVLEKYNQGLNHREIAEELSSELEEDITKSKIVFTIDKMKKLGIIDEETYKSHFEIIEEKDWEKRRKVYDDTIALYRKGLYYRDIAEELNTELYIIKNRINYCREKGLITEEIEAERESIINENKYNTKEKEYSDLVSLYVTGISNIDMAKELGISVGETTDRIRECRQSGRITDEIEAEHNRNKKILEREKYLVNDRVSLPDGVEVPEHYEYKVVITKSQIEHDRFWVGDTSAFPLGLEVNFIYKDTLYRGTIKENQISVQRQLRRDACWEINTGVKLIYTKNDNTFRIELLSEDDEFLIESLRHKNENAMLKNAAKFPEIDMFTRYTIRSGDIKYSTFALGKYSGYNNGIELDAEYNGKLFKAQVHMSNAGKLYIGREIFKLSGWKEGSIVDIEYTVKNKMLHIKDVTEKDIEEGYDLLEEWLF